MGKAHILGLTEDLDLRLDGLIDVLEAALEGQLQYVQEKLDGQNFTFTWKDGAIRFLGKGIMPSLASSGGLDRQGLVDRYKDKPEVLRAFLGAYDALQACVLPSFFRDDATLMHNGIAVSCEVITPLNPNIVEYATNAICPLTLLDMTGGRAPQTLTEGVPGGPLFGSIKWNEWVIRTNPYMQVQRHPSFLKKIELLDGPKGLRQLIRASGVPLYKTVRDLSVQMVWDHLSANRPKFLDASLLESAAHRLVSENSLHLNKDSFAYGSQWKEFQELEKDRTVIMGLAMAPLEHIMQDICDAVFSMYNFHFALSNDPVCWRRFVKRVKDNINGIHAFGADRRRIEAALVRLGDENLITKNVEGIVFSWAGKRRKMTGRFAALNRLHGFFKYGYARFTDGR